MSGPVKSRVYDSRRRQARSRLTCAAIIDAARTLFLQHGYAATTVDMISDASGTAPATVYRLFSSKLGILKELLDVSAVGDDEPTPLGERANVQALLAESNPRKQTEGFAHLAGQVMSRLAPVQQILCGAAASDPEAAAMLAEHTRQRQHGQARIAASLASANALRRALTQDDAADIIHALMSPEVYRLLTKDRGWATERYEAWLAATLDQQLLEPRRRRA